MTSQIVTFNGAQAACTNEQTIARKSLKNAIVESLYLEDGAAMREHLEAGDPWK